LRLETFPPREAEAELKEKGNINRKKKDPGLKKTTVPSRKKGVCVA